jgi:hypothetical protein
LQTARGAGACKLLILLAGFGAVSAPPVFWQKSSDLLDSKGLDFCKSDKEFATD